MWVVTASYSKVHKNGSNISELTTDCKLVSKQKRIYSKFLCFKVKQTRTLLFKVQSVDQN